MKSSVLIHYDKTVKFSRSKATLALPGFICETCITTTTRNRISRILYKKEDDEEEDIAELMSMVEAHY